MSLHSRQQYSLGKIVFFLCIRSNAESNSVIHVQPIMLFHLSTAHLLYHRLMEECGIEMYCDLHAHSRKHNIFIYGCENRRSVDRLQEQVFPLMLHKNAADKVVHCFTSKLNISDVIHNLRCVLVFCF